MHSNEPGGALRRISNATASWPPQLGDSDEELATDGEVSLSRTLSALALPVYVPRAILSIGAGLTAVTRPLFARHIGCDDLQIGYVAAAVPLVPSPPWPFVKALGRSS